MGAAWDRLSSDPAFIKTASLEELAMLAEEIRTRIIEVVLKNGGHLASNLGVVELTLAMHRVFSTPRDAFIFDVAHQGYAHKIVTDRCARFTTLRQTGGIGGFLFRDESPHDACGGGHAGTALSTAVGMAKARDMLGKDFHVVCLVGDASLTCGITMEALNHLTTATRRLVVVLNDNEWSIDRNVGALAKCLNELITHPLYNRFHGRIKRWLRKIPGGDGVIRWIGRLKTDAKNWMLPSSLFERYGLRYLGPVDGHNLPELISYLSFCKEAQEPILLHVRTIKGKGFEPARSHPEVYHGVGGTRGDPAPKPKGAKYSDVFGETLLEIAREDRRVVAVVAAMKLGTGLKSFADALPEQFVDVGIAEEHAVVFAAGLAVQGVRPVCAIYSTFLQRAFDCIQQDVCLPRLPVVFCLDRAGPTLDGPTHHGLWDLTYLRCLPNAVVAQPKGADELRRMLRLAFQMETPVFIRYPRESESEEGTETSDELSPGRAEVVREGKEVILWVLGDRVWEFLPRLDRMEKEMGCSVGLVNARFAKPIDEDLLRGQARYAKLFVTIEDNVLAGGFGSAVLEILNDEACPVPVCRIGWPDKFVPFGSSVEDLRRECGLQTAQVEETIFRTWRGL
ncbi:MAG: 1-deoxy-D-xylulose-5-phosphate synthase [Puniceicoccales bacterium]|jgi:1-deoxy-D-xylulose-5-phosphate synthase|nr:1-deoxy-D-xylulose-5-phosphate synthase [Puniceicoccales bacterium]